MTMGQTPAQGNLFSTPTSFCDKTLGPTSLYRYLHENGHRLFPDEMFADLFQDIGRESIPPQIVAIVMVLQRLEGLSDREAVDRFAYDLRWKYAAGGLPFDYDSFVHTVLVKMRAKLRNSERPNRIFEVALEAARGAGLVGRKRALDSTPLYDAVVTQDTVTMIRAAIRGLLRVADAELEAELRAVLQRDDDYVSAGKPACDWNDEEARTALVDALCRDAWALLAVLHDRPLDAAVREASELLATVVGQDIETTDDGRFQIAQRVAKDRVISTVDPEARHGHKTSARGFDGYKGHISIDPDSEIIVSTEVTPGNAADGAVAKKLLEPDLPAEPVPAKDEPQSPDEPDPPAPESTSYASSDTDAAENAEPADADANVEPSPESAQRADAPAETAPLEVYGDSAYGTGEILAHLDEHGAVAYVKVQPPSARKGLFTKADFCIDLEHRTVTCPQQHTVPIRPRPDGSAVATFGKRCQQCPLRSQCTSSDRGRKINIHAQEQLLERARQQQRSDPEWNQRYQANRPKVERRFAHLTKRRHGGRRARVRGRLRVALDFALLAAATNLQRLARLMIPIPARPAAPACP